MAAITAGGPIKMTLEQPDGTIIELTGAVSEYQLEQNVEVAPVSMMHGEPVSEYIPSSPEFTATFKIQGDVFNLFSDVEWEREVENRLLSKEWQCDWCRSPNEWMDKQCTQCGGSRSFIYD